MRIKAHGTLKPQHGNWYGKPRLVDVITSADGTMRLVLSNVERTREYDVVLDTGEAASLVRLLAAHLEMVAAARSAGNP